MDDNLNLQNVIAMHVDAINTNSFTPETKLWRRVISHALEDTLIINSDRKKSLAKVKAHNWITSQQKDFCHACYHADLDPDMIHETYIKMIKQGLIKFNARQIKWVEYQTLWEKIKKVEGIRAKRQLRAKIKTLRIEVLTTNTNYLSTVFITPIK